MIPNSVEQPVLFERRFISFDETPIFYKTLRSASEPNAVVLIIHGMGEHGGRYLPLAEYLSGIGIESLLMDLRGFGQSGGKKACVNRFLDYHRDLEALHLLISKTRKNSPIFILGHSFGGLIASSYAAFFTSAPLRGLILSSPLFGIAIPVPSWKSRFGLMMSYCFPDYAQTTKVNPKFLTHDEGITKKYEQDPYIFHKISARLYREMIKTINQKDAISKTLSLPTLLLQAGEDYIVSKGESLKFFDHLAAQDKELQVYEGFYHEILNEVKRAQVYSRIGNWVLDRCK